MRLDQVLEEARTRGPQVLTARASVAVADADVEKAWTAWKPNVSAAGQLTFNSTEQSFDFAGFAVPLASAIGFPLSAQQLASFPPATVIAPHVQLAALLNLKQTLFNITAVRAPGVAKAARAASEAAVVATEEELMFLAAQLYVTVVGLDTLAAATDRAIEIAEKRVHDQRAQLEAGSTTQLAVTRAETDKASAQAQKLTVESQKRTLLANLAALIGKTTAIEVSKDPIETQVTLEPPANAVDRAKVKAREAGVIAANAAVGLTSASWLPSLNVEGTLRYSNVSGFGDENFLATASVNLIVPIYDSGIRYADTHASEARVARAQAELDNERVVAQAYLVEAENKVDSAKAELTLSEAQLKLATEGVAQAESLGGAGLATNLELADADTRRFQADQLVAQKRFLLDVARLQLVYARGGKLEPKR